MTNQEQVILLSGAGAFGAMIGWYVYYVNRYRKGDVQLGDITTLVGVIGGGAVLTLFKEGTPIFGAYGLGLFVGFFGYLVVLSLLVKKSPNFNVDFFLDGRRKKLSDDEMIPPDIQQTVRAMTVQERVEALEQSVRNHATTLNNRTTFVAAEITAVAWAPTAAAKRVIDACEDSWNDLTKADCNKYAKAVVGHFGLTDFGPVDGSGDDANAIAAKLADATWRTGNGWIHLADGKEARAAAVDGKLVIGGISGTNYAPPTAHGHVVVVVASEKLHRDRYPFAYWGKLNSVGEKNAPVTQAFNSGSVDKVVYAAKKV